VSRIKLRCHTCGGKLGMVHHTSVHWSGSWWRKLRFCRSTCLDSYLKKRAEDLERKKSVSLLFHPPPSGT